MDPDVWRRAGEIGLLCCSIPAEYGGGGGTFAHDLAVFESQARAGDHAWATACTAASWPTTSWPTAPKISAGAGCRGWPRGELVAAVAMTEPGAGSDLKNISTRAVRDGDEYVINGAKTFITNGHTADLIVVVAKTDPRAGAKGISLLVVETGDCPGFVRGRILDKIGQHGADTSELFFDGSGSRRPTCSAGPRAAASAQLDDPAGPGTADHRGQRGRGHGSRRRADRGLRQATAKPSARSCSTSRTPSSTLAECATTAHVGRVFVDSCIQRHLDGGLDATTAAMAKCWLTEQQVTVIDRCLQLYGGYGYMREYPIARMYADARVQKIYGGANEIMKDLVARSLR